MTEEFSRLSSPGTLAFVIQTEVVIEFYSSSKKFMDDVRLVLAKAGPVFIAENSADE